MIRMLIAGFPDLKPHDPEGYIAGMTTIATLYPAAHVFDVVKAGFKFAPTFYDFRQALEKEAQRVWRMQRLIERSPEAMTYEEARASLAELEDRCLEVGIDIRPGWQDRAAHPRAGIAETAEEVRARLGITQEQWDAIPDQPQKSA